MTTPAQQAGFKVGEKYRTKPESWVGGGHIIVFSYDDGTESPQFRGDSNVYGGGPFYERLSHVEPIGEEVEFHVSVNPNSTTIVIQKRLSLDEVAAVLKAAGV